VRQAQCLCLHERVPSLLPNMNDLNYLSHSNCALKILCYMERKKLRAGGLSMNTEQKAVVGSNEVIELAADIVAAYVSNNTLAPAELPDLIKAVQQALMTAAAGAAEAPKEELKPAVPIRRSVTPDYIICLEDGKKFKSLKRHLRTQFDMSPEEYRKKWGLQADYPMVAPNYAAARSALAKSMGLGRKAAGTAKRRGRKAA
jgi:predicted transcriptional regulator